ncbi:MAG: CbrC family protein [Bryobacterales bacterium]|nr:CbrC family protein [Bryobacterales bacterium]
MSLPRFRYHPDPLRSGSVGESPGACRCCGQTRGYIYRGPVYSDYDLDDSLCPWCIADGSAAARFDASFVDEEGLSTDASDALHDELLLRTPGYNSWQNEVWPMCCSDATAFIAPAGLTELRRDFPDWEEGLRNHILFAMKIPSRAATNLLESLHRDVGPTAYLFECLHCSRRHFHIDEP